MKAQDYESEFDRVWPRIAAYLPRAWQETATLLACSPPDDVAIERMRAKARRGHVEHSGEIFGWSEDDYRRAIREEMDDLAIYRAFEIAATEGVLTR